MGAEGAENASQQVRGYVAGTFTGCVIGPFVPLAASDCQCRAALVGGDRKDAEILALRHQILVLQRQIDRPSFASTDRTILALLSRAFDQRRLKGGDVDRKTGDRDQLAPAPGGCGCRKLGREPVTRRFASRSRLWVPDTRSWLVSLNLGQDGRPAR